MDFKDFEAYLKIDPTRYDKPTLEALSYYVERFMVTVPFENINVQNGVPISLKIEDNYDKVVNQHRGGFCYELNPLFQAYLLDKGFDATLTGGTIHTPDGGFSNDEAHALVYVTIDGTRYIADVAFGDLPLMAFPITQEDNAQPVEDITGRFRAIYRDDKEDYFYVQKEVDGEWDTQYEAVVEPKTIADFEWHAEYHQTHPESFFVNLLIISRPQPFGRASLSQNNLTLTDNKKQTKEKFTVTPENYRDYLKHYFDLDVTIDRLEAK
ncbi:arylamine N-acetyltransferase [Staphylococcus sp. 11261D007BR]